MEGHASISSDVLARYAADAALDVDGVHALVGSNLPRHRPVRIVQDAAPQALPDLPDPDAVFIGGSGGNLSGIVRTALERLSGRISAADMRAMNYAADAEHRDVRKVAREFVARLR